MSKVKNLVEMVQKNGVLDRSKDAISKTGVSYHFETLKIENKFGLPLYMSKVWESAHVELKYSTKERVSFFGFEIDGVSYKIHFDSPFKNAKCIKITAHKLVKHLTSVAA